MTISATFFCIFPLLRDFWTLKFQSREKELNEEEIKWIKKEMNAHKTIQKSYELAKKLAFEGLEAIKKYDIKELEEILQKILNRSF